MTARSEGYHAPPLVTASINTATRLAFTGHAFFAAARRRHTILSARARQLEMMMMPEKLPIIVPTRLLSSISQGAYSRACLPRGGKCRITRLLIFYADCRFSII